MSVFREKTHIRRIQEITVCRYKDIIAYFSLFEKGKEIYFIVLIYNVDI